MPTPRNGLGDVETVLTQRFHKCELLLRGQARHVHPAGGLALAQVITVVLDGAEGDAAEPVDLEDALLFIRSVLVAGCGRRIRGSGRGADVDVGFFTGADAGAGAVEGVALQMGVEGEVVEAAIGEAVAVVFGILGAADEVCFGKGGDRFVDSTAATEVGELDDQGGGDDFMVFAANFDLRRRESANSGRRSNLATNVQRSILANLHC